MILSSLFADGYLNGGGRDGSLKHGSTGIPSRITWTGLSRMRSKRSSRNESVAFYVRGKISARF